MLLAPDGERHTLVHGDVLGRLWSAALHINDGRVSECHAMISTRGAELQLLGLRGRFRVGGEVRREVDLKPGQHIELAPGVWVTVEAVHPPSALLALEAPGMPRVVVTGVASLVGGERPAVRPGWNADADGQIWPTGEGWMRSGPHAPEPVDDGSTWSVAGTTFRAVLQVGAQPTADDRIHGDRLRIVAHYDAAHVHLADGRSLVLSGLCARLVSELVAVGQPIGWEALAAELWGPLETSVLRKRFDMQLSRLRHKLRAVGVRTNLVIADGTGLVQLVLGPDDVAEDAS
ncbi:MAG: FHA domain-containing protein [Alphaproteobacteria bacterium]|nr:FHA domain-containing protein [Alphaproteobacteria bacterium]MCB9694291.1 FHA domain-containing protein [Alphaproteobacteria bacterium]